MQCFENVITVARDAEKKDANTTPSQNHVLSVATAPLRKASGSPRALQMDLWMGPLDGWLGGDWFVACRATGGNFLIAWVYNTIVSLSQMFIMRINYFT